MADEQATVESLSHSFGASILWIYNPERGHQPRSRQTAIDRVATLEPKLAQRVVDKVITDVALHQPRTLIDSRLISQEAGLISAAKRDRCEQILRAKRAGRPLSEYTGWIQQVLGLPKYATASAIIDEVVRDYVASELRASGITAPTGHVGTSRSTTLVQSHPSAATATLQHALSWRNAPYDGYGWRRERGRSSSSSSSGRSRSTSSSRFGGSSVAPSRQSTPASSRPASTASTDDKIQQRGRRLQSGSSWR